MFELSSYIALFELCVNAVLIHNYYYNIHYVNCITIMNYN
jgi:hypothetical protein